MNEEQFEKHTFEYQHKGKTWVAEIVATSEEDAWQRVHMLQYATYTDVEAGSLPAKLGFFVKAGCFIANLVGRRSH